jgi:hypothetical protein
MIRYAGLAFLRPLVDRAKTPILLLVASILLAAPALLNGFPFIFLDSTGYMNRAVFVTSSIRGKLNPSCATHGAARAGCVAQASAQAKLAETYNKDAYAKISRNPFFTRPVTYCLFLLPFSLPLTVFLLPIAQGFLASYSVWRLLRTLGTNRPAIFLGFIGLLMVGSSLPVHVSYMMPDIFAGILVIAMFTAISDWPLRSKIGRLGDIVLIAALTATHLSYLPLSLAMLAFFGLCAAFVKTSQVRASAVGAVGIVPMLLASLFLAGSNFAVDRKAQLSESSPLFLLARLIGDGPARDYLKAECGQKHYLVCAELAGLGSRGPEGKSISDHFLWDPSGAVKRIADPRLVPQATEINRETIRRYPLPVLTNFLLNGLRQLGGFQIDPDILTPPPAFARGPAATMGEPVVRAYLGSAQVQGRLPIALLRLQTVLSVVGAIVAIAAVSLLWWRRLDARHWLFLAVVAVGLAANALATGGLSDLHNRYGNRIIWLLPAVAIAFVIRARKSPAQSAQSDVPSQPVADRHTSVRAQA